MLPLSVEEARSSRPHSWALVLCPAIEAGGDGSGDGSGLLAAGDGGFVGEDGR
jgi:hypothetical protein